VAKSRSGYDVIIIGAGIIGCSIALALNRRGVATLNVEALPAAGYGSTSNSAAIIRPYYSTADGTALAMEGHHYWANWNDVLRYEPEDPLRYIQCGCLVLEAAANHNLPRTRSILAQVGVPYENIAGTDLKHWLPDADLRRFGPPKRINDPAFGETDGSHINGAIFCPTGGYVTDPQLACRQVAKSVEMIGGDFLFSDTVTAICSAAGAITGVVTRGGGSISAPIVVNAAGPASAGVNALAGAIRPNQIGTRALRQEVAHLNMPYVADTPSLRCVLTDADCGIYMRPEQQNHLLVGSLEPACDRLEYVSPDCFNADLSEQWTNQVWRAALRFPSLDVPNTAKGIVALYDVSDDWIPIYDRSDVDGYFTAIGTSGNQFKNAPVVGEMMAELIDYVQSGNDHDEKPLRFRLRHHSTSIDLRSFSRLRALNEGSSFSVLG
jgi:sarcosine oxidase subunit beta